MNLDDVINDGSKFLKIKENESVKGQFSGDFVKKESEQYGVKYEVTFHLTNGETKTWSGSSTFYDQCRKKATAAGKGFYDVTFKITRTGTGLDTRYNAQPVIEGQVVQEEQAPVVNNEGSGYASDPFK